jgi:predicted nucleotidyltransferase
MISETDEKIIQQHAKKYNVSSTILYGSSLEKDKKANDIDLGVKGIEPRLFFKFYAELFKHLSKPAHLSDLSKKSLFNDHVEETGVQIYGQSA